MCDRVTNLISTAVTMKIILITISHHQASSWKFLIAIIKILGGKWSLTKKPAATNSQSLITEFVSWPSRRLSSVQNNGNQWIDNDYQMKHGIGFVVFFLVISTVKPWSKSPWSILARKIIEKNKNAWNTSGCLLTFRWLAHRHIVELQLKTMVCFRHLIITFFLSLIRKSGSSVFEKPGDSSFQGKEDDLQE